MLSLKLRSSFFRGPIFTQIFRLTNGRNNTHEMRRFRHYTQLLAVKQSTTGALLALGWVRYRTPWRTGDFSERQFFDVSGEDTEGPLCPIIIIIIIQKLVIDVAVVKSSCHADRSCARRFAVSQSPNQGSVVAGSFAMVLSQECLRRGKTCLSSLQEVPECKPRARLWSCRGQHGWNDQKGKTTAEWCRIELVVQYETRTYYLVTTSVATKFEEIRKQCTVLKKIQPKCWPTSYSIYSTREFGYELLRSSAAALTQDYFLGPSFPLHCSYHLEFSAEHWDSSQSHSITNK